MKKVNIVITIVLIFILSILGIPSIKYFMEILNFYPEVIEKSKQIGKDKQDKSNQQYSLFLGDKKMNVEFEKSLSTIIDVNKRCILRDTIVVEILDSSCGTTACGYIAFAKAVRGKIANGDTLVFVTVCLDDHIKKDSELHVLFTPGEKIKYCNDEPPEFSVELSGCERTGDLKKYPYVIARPVDYP